MGLNSERPRLAQERPPQEKLLEKLYAYAKATLKRKPNNLLKVLKET